MAKRTRKTSNGGHSISLNKFAFWLVVVIGIAMLVSYSIRWMGGWFNWGGWITTLSSWVQTLCFILALFVPLILSYRHARNKSLGWFVAWIIFAVLIAFGLVSALIALF
ncbi:MAG: hypothetical protein K2F90_00085 [Clostridiales bacterium]|nr:hypothetical protein [Clostridiales bacterium]